jgi:hypothetical protein
MRLPRPTIEAGKGRLGRGARLLLRLRHMVSLLNVRICAALAVLFWSCLGFALTRYPARPRRCRPRRPLGRAECGGAAALSAHRVLHDPRGRGRIVRARGQHLRNLGTPPRCYGPPQRRNADVGNSVFHGVR